MIEQEKQEQNIGNVPSVYQFDNMIESIEPDTLVLYTTSTDDGFGTFCIDGKGLCASRWDSESTAARFAILVSAYLGQLEAFKGKAPLQLLTRLSIELSNVVIKPLVSLLKSYSRLIFVPSGHLSRFPLAALSLDSKYLIFDKVVWQIPSLGFQCHHHRNEDPVPAPQVVSAIAKPGTLKAEVMPEGEPRLPMGGIEALIIGMFSDHRVLNAAKLSRDDFCKELSQAQMLHICTHGYIDTHRPLNSYISLKERLRILDLTGVGSHAGVVIFSTCLSGAGNPHPNDDVVGFAHAILATGVKLFAGCLWKVNDVTTLLHTYFTYWLIREKGGYFGSFVDLWDFATRILLNMNTTGARNHLLDILSIWDLLDEAGRKPNDFVRGGRQRLIDAIDDLTNTDDEPLLDFAHPYFWAPYTITGYADWKLMMASQETLIEMEKLEMELKQRLGREPTRTELWTVFWEARDSAVEAREE